jgi:hypothetical protein
VLTDGGGDPAHVRRVLGIAFRLVGLLRLTGALGG